MDTQILLDALYEEDEALHKADLALRGQMASLGIRIALRARLRQIAFLYGCLEIGGDAIRHEAAQDTRSPLAVGVGGLRN